MEISVPNQEAAEIAKVIQAGLKEVSEVVVGQKAMLERLMLGLMADGHILLEGLPGLAKTLAVKSLATILDLPFSRIQFTPDLLPSDLIGTMIYNQKTGEFHPKKGPVFTSILLADEINRAPPKVQSALLEAMAERQVTIGDQSHKLPQPFLVLATQNPIEQEGTYILPEAQLDRFLFKIHVGYPTREEEKEIVKRLAGGDSPRLAKILGADQIKRLRDLTTKVYVDQKIMDYVVAIVFATRDPAQAKVPDISRFINIGASPRASIGLVRAAKANALLAGRGFVTPDDVRAIIIDVLRHRLVLSYEAEAEGVDAHQIIKRIVDAVPVP